MIVKVTNRPMSITDLYNCVAVVMGYEPSECKYDCTKINVSNHIADNIENYYYNKGKSKEEFGMSWLLFGPKVDESLFDCEVEVKDEFIIKEV